MRGVSSTPYDPCVANDIIKGSQMNVCFHIDDCKLIHKSLKVVGNAITWFKQEYESIFQDGSVEITFHQVKVHNYLGMTRDHTKDKIFKVNVIDYINEILKDTG